MLGRRTCAWVLAWLVAGCGAERAAPEPDASEPVPGVVALGVLRSAGLRQLIVRSGARGVLATGAPVLDDHDRPLPVAQIANPLTEGDVVDLGRRTMYVLVSLDGNLRWIEPAHSRDEVIFRERELARELARLPAGPRALVEPRLRIIAVVSAAEGSFDGIATHAGDPAASLGIFQWAVARAGNDEGSSLARFFGDLKARAVRCDQTPEQAFYCAAWAQGQAVGLDVRGGRIFVRGAPATGELVERGLRAQVCSGMLRAYQLVAANDWVERVSSATVRVGADRRTVGEVLHDPRALATAVLLGVNRPSWVVPALERAARRVGTDDLDRLVRELRSEALARYPAAEREARARRLLTSESGW